MTDIPKPPPKREHTFSLRLTEAERNALFATAERLQITPSHFVRQVVKQAIKRIRID